VKVYPGTPASAVVATSGSPKKRSALVTASALNWPARMNSSSAVGESTMKSMRRAIRSVIACALPR
jgi:hypothetical protein